jgi:hypothetical protein
MVKKSNKLMKTRILFFLVILLLSSCRYIHNIISTPNDDPGAMLNVSSFKANHDTLQLKTDLFIENNQNITRVYNIGGYDKGVYRQYRMLCNSDTLQFNVVFSGNDTISKIAVSFFKMHNIIFTTSDHNTQKKQIKNNKTLYNICQACYIANFLNPLKNITEKVH